MPSNFVVGIWSVDTVRQGPRAWLKKPFDLKAAMLNEALSIFHTVRVTAGNVPAVPDQVVRAIFVAPEYFFTVAKNNETRDRDYLDVVELRGIQARLMTPANVLVVPGTMAYREIDDKAATLRTAYHAAVQPIAAHATHVPHLADAARTNFLHNVAFGYLGGQKVIESRKQKSATDGPSAGEAFVPGWGSNKATLNVASTGAARTLSFGIEICADASSHAGGTGYVDTAVPGTVDIKILVSAVLPNADVYAGNCTGALIHACSDPQYSGISIRGAGVTVAAIPPARQLYNAPMSFYRLSIP
ncbi:MAG TPA: hypothetical protein VEU30_13275 [Thermoanaerobaculia bacterium]|nr:hypothetical protein [Thermoanaerobaculia bacterium]